MSEFITVLSEEFGETFDDSAFLMQIRYDFRWDDNAFTRLTAAMEECCEHSQAPNTLDRWIADGFCYVSWFVQEWTKSPRFPREYSEGYYEEAYTRLSNLMQKYFHRANSLSDMLTS